MSEKQDILDLLQENEAELDLLAQLYNGHKECLDQAKLTQDLERLLAYACLLRANPQTHSPTLRSKIDEYYQWLKVNGGKPRRKVPTLKAVWKAGDLKPKLEAWNRDISRIRAHWQVRNVLLPMTVVHRLYRIKSAFGWSHSFRVRSRKCWTSSKTRTECTRARP